MDYDKLKEFLEYPDYKLLDIAYSSKGFEEPEVERWEAPKGPLSLASLVVGLSYKQKLLCIITAAEMLLPYWHDYNFEYPYIPRGIISVAYCALRGDEDLLSVTGTFRLQELYQGLIRYEQRLEPGRGLRGHVIYSFMSLGETLIVFERDKGACQSVNLFPINSVAQVMDYYVGYARWWSKVRTRLPINEATTASITW